MKQWQKNLPSVQSGFQVSLEATLLRVICFVQRLYLGQDIKVSEVQSLLIDFTLLLESD